MKSMEVAPRNNEIISAEEASNRKVYKIGDKAEMTKTFSDEDFINYVRATGDSNPIHCNDVQTANRFKGRLVHGMLVGGIISTVIGTKMPGYGTIYVAQNMKFVKPVYINDSIIVHVEITDVNETKKRLFLATNCFNSKGELVTIGEAIVIPPEWLI